MISAAALLATLGCGSSHQLGMGTVELLSEGVINDPANRSLRFDLLKYGLESFCRQMLQRGVALKQRDGQPTLGRFHASDCETQPLAVNGRQSLLVRYDGAGFAWSNLSGRVGFVAKGLVEYAPDFQMVGPSLYLYFRARNVGATSFTPSLIEGALAQVSAGVQLVNAEQVGRNLLELQLRRGFTVIREDEGGRLVFGMGLIPLGRRPFEPFQLQSSSRFTVDNDRTEVYAGQQDYLGPFEVSDAGQALFLSLKLEGTTAIDVAVLPEAKGQMLLERYRSQPGPAPLGGAGLHTVAAGPDVVALEVPTPPGRFYVLLDHSAQGAVAPDIAGQAARVDYLIQVGDRP